MAYRQQLDSRDGIRPSARNRTGSTRQRRPRRTLTVGLTVALVGLLGGCGDGSSSEKTSALTSTVKEFSITLSSASVSSGAVRVKVHNAGLLTHEIVAFRTDLEEAALPLTSDGGRVDEAGQGITHLDPEAEDVAPGQDKAITIDLTPGRYVLVCNLPDHYKQGMHAVLTVT